MNTQQSEKMFAKATTYMPGGVNSPVRAFGYVGRNPLFIKRACGSKIYDVDGNELIDYVCSWGPGILGHAHPEVIEAVTKAAACGLTFGAPTERETQLCELIQACIPSMEMMRMVSSGTEAVMSAIRAARGYTGRDKILKFKGCYHGHSDGLLVKAGSAALTSSVPDSAGVPKSLTENTLVALYNDEDSVRELFDNNRGEIAALIVEPVAANMGVVLPKPGFLQFLRRITEENGTVLIFDEVITGFRVSLGGAQAYYGIHPDMTTLGKIVGGGMPLAVYGGRADIMKCVSPVGKVYQAGTLSGNPIATAAGIKTLELLMADTSIYEKIEKNTALLKAAYEDYAKTSGTPLAINQVGSLLCAFFVNQPKIADCASSAGCKSAEFAVANYDQAADTDAQAFTTYFGKMLDNGIYVAPSQFEAMFISGAHSDEDIRRTCDVIRHL